jgi:hypothetical protein
MSKIADKIYEILNEIFPRLSAPRVTKEIYVNYKGQKLFFDFFIVECSMYVECQGEQHSKFVKHFHSDREAFTTQKMRDNLKIQYVNEENKCLIRFNYDEEITKDLVLYKINSAMDSGDGFCE